MTKILPRRGGDFRQNPKGLTLQLKDGPEGDVSIDYLLGRIDTLYPTISKEDICKKIDNIKKELSDIEKYL